MIELYIFRIMYNFKSCFHYQDFIEKSNSLHRNHKYSYLMTKRLSCIMILHQETTANTE